MNSSPIVVYILTSDVESKQTGKLASLFSHPMFKVNILSISPPNDLKSDMKDKKVTDKNLAESYRIRWCLKDAKKNTPKNHVVVLKDTSVSNASTNQMANVISAAINSGNWDVCYLAKWLDRCDLHSNKKPINGTMTTLSKTVSPHGLQALVFSPNGRDVVLGDKKMKNGELFQNPDKPLDKPLDEKLNENIANKNITATTPDPNLINFDISSAKKPSDFLKASECDIAEILGDKKMQEVKQTSNWFWFLLIIVIVLLILGFLFYKNKNSSKPLY